MCGAGFVGSICVLPCNFCYSHMMGSSCTKPVASLYPSGFQAQENWRVAICQSREDNEPPSVCPCRGGCQCQNVSSHKTSKGTPQNHQWNRFPNCSRVSPCDITQLYVNRVSNQDAWLAAPSYSEHICKCCDKKSLGSNVSLQQACNPQILFDSCSNITHFKSDLEFSDLTRFKSDLENRNLELKNFVVTRHFTCEEKQRSVIFNSSRSLQSKNINESCNIESNINNLNSNNHNDSITNASNKNLTVINKRGHQWRSVEGGVLRLALPCHSYESREIILKNCVKEIEGTDNRQGINQLFLRSYLMTIQDPASQRLTWYKPPLSVLVIKKARDAQVVQPFLQLVKWLNVDKRMVVFVEATVLEEPLVTSHPAFPSLKDKLMSFREGQDDLTDRIDFIICLGGDGTLLYASSLFQQSVPPVMAFHLGSLGFLTPFKFDNFQEQVTNVLEGHAALTLRSRLRCIILKKEEDGKKDVSPPTNLLVLNEVVIDRGPSPYLSNIDLYLDGKRITSVQGDGLIVSTPTGSTAYAVAAGASMIHPSVPAIMVTPICPHSLSFRPIVVPAGVELMIAVSKESRNTAWVSFDGRKRQELLHGDSLRVTTSIYPVPSICSEDQIADWFASLDECLRWNDRKRQKHLDDYIDDGVDIPSSPSGSGLNSSATSRCSSNPTASFTPPNELAELNREVVVSSSVETLDSLSEKCVS